MDEFQFGITFGHSCLFLVVRGYTFGAKKLVHLFHTVSLMEIQSLKVNRTGKLAVAGVA